MEDDIRSKNAVNQRKTKVQLAPTDLAYQGKHGKPETFQLDEQDGVAGVSELEDLIEIVNPNGWWNMTSLALGLMAFFMLPLQSVTYQFLGETPAHWCHIPPLTEANWTQQQIRDLAIPLSRFIVESPRWLISQGRYEEAEEILSRIAKLNGRAFPPSKAVVISLKKMATPSESRSGEASFRHIVRNLKEYFILILKQEHRAKILNCYFCWFAVSLVYYGVSLNAGNLSADPYLYVALGSLAKFPCYPISWVLMVYVGRRLSLAICYWMSGVATCVVALLVASMDEVPFGLLMTFAMTGRVAISAAFVICYLYTAELFPTRLRSLAVGQSSVVGRVGSMMSPYINDILGALIVWAPLALFALLSALSAILCPLLLETRGSMIEEGASSPRAKEEEGGGGVGGDPDNSKRRAEGQSVNKGFQED